MAALKELFRNPSPVELDLAEAYTRLPRHGQRERNFEAFAATGLPTRRVETWKYSDLRNALPASGEGVVELTTPFSALENPVEIVFDERGVTAPESLPAGLKLSLVADPRALGGAEDLPVAALGAALASNPSTVQLEVTGKVERPLHLVFRATGKGHFHRVSVLFREGTELSVFESHLAGSGFSSCVTEYALEADAKLERTMYQAASLSAVQVFTAIVNLAARAQIKQTSLGFGAKLCRNETRVMHNGAEARAELNGAYLIADSYHYDQTSHVRHSMPDCETGQLVKGAVKDGGRAVFQGKFFVARKAQKTAAEMTHNALILENGGEVNAKPELEIYADDVECAHGNTVGALDDDALFYLRQRGIPEVQARAMLTQAFIADALDGAPESVRETLLETAHSWLTDHQ